MLAGGRSGGGFAANISAMEFLLSLSISVTSVLPRQSKMTKGIQK
jgi:hypothetical protein